MSSTMAGTPARIASWTSGRIHRFAHRVLLRWRIRRTTLGLDVLDNATLKDIGLCRCEIDRVAHETWLGQSRW